MLKHKRKYNFTKHHTDTCNNPCLMLPQLFAGGQDCGGDNLRISSLTHKSYCFTHRDGFRKIFKMMSLT